MNVIENELVTIPHFYPFTIGLYSIGLIHISPLKKFVTTHDLKFDKELNHFYLNSIDSDNDEDGNELVVSEYQYYACPSLIPSRSS